MDEKKALACVSDVANKVFDVFYKEYESRKDVQIYNTSETGSGTVQARIEVLNVVKPGLDSAKTSINIDFDLELSMFVVTVKNYYVRRDQVNAREVFEYVEKLLGGFGFEGFLILCDIEDGDRKTEKIVFGERAKKIDVMLERLGGIFNEEYYFYYYDGFHIEWDIKKGTLVFVKTGLVRYEFASEEEVGNYTDEKERILGIIKGYRDEIIQRVKKIDPTCYYDKINERLYLYNERIPFWIERKFDGGKIRYKARIGDNNYQNLNLEKLISNLESRFDKLVKERRVHAAISGRAGDMIPGLIYALYNRHFNSYDWNSDFDTSFTEGELNHHLVKNIDTFKKVTLDPFYKDYYQMVLRKRKVGNKIKEAFEISGLYFFVSESKIFILRKDEFKNTSLDYEWKEKRDQSFVKKLEEKKNTFT